MIEQHETANVSLIIITRMTEEKEEEKDTWKSK